MKKSRQQSYVYKRTEKYTPWPTFMWMTREGENKDYASLPLSYKGDELPLVPPYTQWTTLPKGVDYWWLKEKKDVEVEMILPGEFLT